VSTSPLAALEVVRARAPVQTGPGDDQFLAEVVQSASEAIERELGRALTAATFTEVYDGHRKPVGAFREVLYVRNPPVATSPLPTVTENGAAIVVGFANDPTGDVEVFFDPEAGRFEKITGWLPGHRNISIVYTGAVGLPTQELISVCVELTWRTWRLAAKDSGLSNASLPGATFQAMRDLPPEFKRSLDHYRLGARP